MSRSTAIIRIRAAVSGGRLNLLTADDPGAAHAAAAVAGAAPAVNATISGSLPALLQLFKGAGDAKGAAPGRAAQIRGDAEIANRYRELFLLARPDPEEELSRWIGDLPARRLSQFAARALDAARRVRRTAGENIAEYLQEESRDLVNKTELEEFLRGVDESARDRRSDRRAAEASRAAHQGRRLMRLRVLARLLQIQRALVRHGLDDFVRATHLYRPFRFLVYLSPWTWFQRSTGTTRGERLRLALEELGPIFVKFGQALSTRRDLLPADIADELAKLQDRVPPFDGAIAVASVEKIIRRAACERVREFRSGAARRGLHRPGARSPRCRTAREVVVKILRPGMREIIDLDLEVLQYLAELADEYWREARRLRPVELVREYRKTILDELDLLREAGNAAQLKRNFAGSPLLYVPEVYWDYCRVNVMVMERIHGVIVSDLEQLRARGAEYPPAGRERRGDLLHAGVPP